MTTNENSALPFVSVIMPVRNEAGFIARSLGCVLAQDYPAERMEIIIADGQSTDDTRQVIAAFQQQHDNIHLVENPGRIAPTGLNAAIARTRGTIVIRVDGHCEIAGNYVRNCVHHLLHSGAEGVGGPLETIGTTPRAAAIAAAMSSPFGVGGSAFRTVKDQTMLTDTVAFPAYTRAIIERAGPYDEEMVRNQDDEYNYRLRKLGARILLAADVNARYYSRSSMRSLFGQYFQYGYWKVRVWQKHPRQMRWRQFVPPVFAAGLIFSLLLSLFIPGGFWLLLLYCAAYALANLGASYLVASRSGWQHLRWLPLVFFYLHFSYGLGFLLGLVRFAPRWVNP